MQTSEDEKGVRLKEQPFDPVDETKRTVRISGFPVNRSEQEVRDYLMSFPESVICWTVWFLVASVELLRDLNTHHFVGIVYALLRPEQSVEEFVKRELSFGEQKLSVLSLWCCFALFIW